MAEMKKVPAIRFKGFDYEWKGKALDEIGELKNGMNFPKSAMGHGYPFVNLQDVFGRNIVNEKDLGLAVSNENQRKEYGLQKGDVLFIRSSVKPEGVGEAALVKNTLPNTTYSGFIIRFRASTEMDDNFKSFVFSIAGVRKQILSNATSSANTNINQDSLKKIRLKLPIVDEQTQIGSYFQHIDKLISLHQAKVNKLTNLKKAMLEKMFPKQGADVPEIRFKNFEGVWKKIKLGDIGSVSMNKRIFKSQTTDIGEVPFYKIGTFGGEPNSYISGQLFEEYKTKYPYPKKGDLLISAAGSIGKVVEYKGKDEYFQDSNIVWLDHDETLINSFLKQFYLHVKWGGLEGSTIKRLYNKDILETPISLPSIQEQTKIGNYFQNLDNLITLQQTELEKLNNLKKACLEKMFV